MTQPQQLAQAPVRGLTVAEVQQRVDAGLVNRTAERPSRTLGGILRANIFTRFNALLGALLVVILVVGPIQDALFGLVLIANSAVGIVQELRAKRTLDRLSVLNMPTATVVRDGETRQVPASQVVQDDVLAIGPGDQVAVDGTVLDVGGLDVGGLDVDGLDVGVLEVDESLLTGESDPVPKHAGDEVLSGSFVVAGSGRYRASAVGAAAFANRLTSEARHLELARSELRRGIDRILRIVTWVIVPVGSLLVASRLVSDEPLDDAIRGSVAGIGSMVPEGLVLLTSMAFAVSVVRLARQRVVVQDLAAVEILARVDVVCVDKTGTLTEPDLAVTEIRKLGRSDVDVAAVLAALVASESRPNSTMRAIADGVGAAEAVSVVDAVPFASRRKWSAVDLGGHGTWVLGAPEIVLDGDARLLEQIDEVASGGVRVVALVRSRHRLAGEVLPPERRAIALLLLAERIRPGVIDTLAYFASQGVVVKVVSGDHPATVAAVARRVGLPSEVVLDARTLPPDISIAALADLMEATSVVGRVAPDQKRDIVAALQAKGHVVAMTGDGVNDVPALKQADLGVAMGSGSAAARTVAPVVLGDNSFSALPSVLDEGRRVLGNIERVANLFVTKTVYASFLALAVGVVRLPFPFLPRHLTIISSLTIGVPAFFLALAPYHRPARPGFERRVAGFAVPAGLVAGIITLAAFAVARTGVDAMVHARTIATAALFLLGLRLLIVLARPMSRPVRVVLPAAMAALFATTLVLDPVRSFFGLSLPAVLPLVEAGGVVALGLVLIELLVVRPQASGGRGIGDG